MTWRYYTCPICDNTQKKPQGLYGCPNPGCCGVMILDETTKAVPDEIEVPIGTPIYHTANGNRKQVPRFRVVDPFTAKVLNSCCDGDYLLIHLPSGGSAWIPAQPLAEGGVFYE